MEDEMAEQSRAETGTKNAPSSSKGAPPAKKARAEEDLERGAQIAAAMAAPSTLQRSNTAESNMEEEEEGEEEEAGSFDAMNSQTVATDKDTNKMRVRREPAMGLLSLSAVDMVLRGAFIVPRGSESEDMRFVPFPLPPLTSNHIRRRREVINPSCSPCPQTNVIFSRDPLS